MLSSTRTPLLSTPAAARRLALLGGFIACILPAQALTFSDVQFGGFVSQGFLVNTGPNDYLGETSEGTFDFREYAANVSYATGSFRFGAQAFGQKLGEYGDDEILLDWATVDWQPKQWFGVRAGRVKSPRGLYNEALDVDAIRPFVLLPQSVYDARLRDFNASFDGAMVFGNIGLGSMGSVDYKLFYGDVPMKLDSGANDFFNQDIPYPNVSIGMESAVGGTLFWNTPVNGLRLGYSYSTFKDFGMNREVDFFGMLIVLGRFAPDYERNLISAEYMVGDWTFATEVGEETAFYGIVFPGLPITNYLDFKMRYGYLAASRRLGDKWEVGGYYSYSKESQVAVPFDPNGLIFDTLVQHDFAGSVKYAINDRWSGKVELHYLDGAGKIFSTPAKPVPLTARDDSWVLLALKSTYSF